MVHCVERTKKAQDRYREDKGGLVHIQRRLKENQEVDITG